MEENTNVEAVETQPTVDTAETETVEQPAGTDAETNAEKQTSEAAENDAQVQAEESETKPAFLTVKFNKEIRELSGDEATIYAQKGMKYDSISPLLETLKYIAAAQGKTLSDYVGNLRDEHDAEVYDRLLERCGGNEEIAKELLEVEKNKHKTAYDSLINEEKKAEETSAQELTQRLASEFEELKEEFPALTEFEKVPKAVVRDAAQKGISLLDAYLRYSHHEQKAAEKVRAAQESAAKNSTGSQTQGTGDTTSPAVSAMLKGVWGK